MKKIIRVAEYRCEKCNARVIQNQKFCSDCGNNLTIENIIEEPTVTFRCGDDISP